MDWRGYAYGEEVSPPVGFGGVGTPPRGILVLEDGSALFVEQVKPGDYEAFMERIARADARLLPIVIDSRGKRERSLASAAEMSREEPLEGFPSPRTVGWCLNHLVNEGRGLDSHFEYFKSLCNLQQSQWGMEEYSNLISVAKALIQQDQLDIVNIAGAELIFRRLQAIEYSYSDKLREKSSQSAGSRLPLDEQAAFGAAARAESKLMISPLLLEAARSETEREAGLAKSILKAREARAALAKKS